MSEAYHLERIAEELEIESIPASWRTHWPAFVEWERAGGSRERVSDVPPNAEKVFDLPAGVLLPLCEIYSKIESDAGLRRLAALWHFLIFHLPGSTGDNPNGWPLPEKRLCKQAALFPLAVLASGTEHAWKAFEDKGVNADIAYATLAFGGLYVRDYHDQHGTWGLSELGWLRNHVRANIFRLGRMVFNASTFKWPFRAFRNRKTGEVITLCDAAGRYSADGLADGTNGVTDFEAWIPELDIRDGSVSGHQVSAAGRALQSVVTLSQEEWEQALAPGNAVIDVHIPSGSKLFLHECNESYQWAKAFFTGLSPETAFAAFTCRSWLMDPGLAIILPHESNIVRFQQQFQLLPISGDHKQTYDIVFGNSRIELADAPRATQLQRVIVGYVQGGSQMRSAAGYFLWSK
jgi:hypothetical protein